MQETKIINTFIKKLINNSLTVFEPMCWALLEFRFIN